MEHFDVVVVGAGISGIDAAYHLQTMCPDRTFVMLEGRDDIGGTWDLFTYPGIRSDSDMHTLGFGFKPWVAEKSIADGPAIMEYLRETVAEYDIEKHIRFQHLVRSAQWSTETGTWTITVEKADTGETVQLTCGYLFMCSGYYSYKGGYLPDFDGYDDFQGQIVHPQDWPEDLDYKGKKVVVIGSGATAVTLVPAMADDTEHITMLQRSPTYMVSRPDHDVIANNLRKVLPDKVAYDATRWKNSTMQQFVYGQTRKNPQKVRQKLLDGVKEQLPEGYDIDTHFTPDYDPWDQRLCADPNGAFFAVIRRGDATVVTDTIERFTEDGIRLESGDELTAEVVVTATGLELLFLGGMDIVVDGDPVDLAERLTYRGMMLEDVPNMAMAVGYTNASWTLKCDLTCDYVARLLSEMRRRGAVQATPRCTDDAVSPEPLLSLTAGYVQRSAHLFPRQGRAAPWRVHQSYLRDYRAMRAAPIVDDALELTS